MSATHEEQRTGYPARYLWAMLLARLFASLPLVCPNVQCQPEPKPSRWLGFPLRRWDWRAANGRLEDMACRSLLLRLEQAGAIRLPPRQRPSPNGYRNRAPRWVAHDSEPIAGALKALTPLRITGVDTASDADRLFR